MTNPPRPNSGTRFSAMPDPTPPDEPDTAEPEPEQPPGSNTPTASHRRLMALRRW